MSSGTIEGNRAIQGTSTSLPTSYGGNGGGICAANGTDVNFSGGTISGNSAFERGGGISMGPYYASEWDSPVLTMTGGTISGNTAGQRGWRPLRAGGFKRLRAYGGTPTYSIARITAGDITGNSGRLRAKAALSSVVWHLRQSGYSSAYTAYHNGELYSPTLRSRQLTRNRRRWLCCLPVSVTEINLTNGAAFYGNSTDSGKARELFIKASLYYGSHSGDPVYEISPSMLGRRRVQVGLRRRHRGSLDDLKGILSAFYNGPCPSATISPR
jgi:hypothetical protein